MVMGPTHAMSGATAGLLLATSVPGVAGPAATLTFAGVCAGAALLPDIDSPHTTVSRSFGPLTWGISKVVNALSVAYFDATRNRKDSPREGGHRTLTHTALFAAAAGLGTAAVTGWGGKWAVLAVLFFMLGLALRGLMADWAKRNGWLGVTVVAAGLTWLAAANIPDAGQAWLGAAVAAGVLLHDLGDMITKQGAPLLAPFIPHKGKNWWEFTLPIRIRAGGAFEYAILLPAFTVVTVLLCISVFPDGQRLLSGLWHNVSD